ncbi:hypothetical protein [Lysinibacillus endophyticus]|uniref:hypothetical protein n=1 Tax=Ureibacillus endophyticus TaxID=1978490 RepID=UPI00209E5D82|nr:hypothetical protein [Lysinibacillus endophyticus]MCP1144857.1 hypothetical protein [Lysinibacillus endophyticus]
MDKLAEALISTINSVFGEDKLSLIFYLGLLLIAILLFKEFKNRIADESAIKKEQLDMALKSLLELKFELVKFRDISKEGEAFEQLKIKIIDAFPYASYKLGKKLHNINTTIDNAQINELIKLLNLEIEGLKYNQDSSIAIVNSYNIIDTMSYIYRTRFHTVFTSSMMTLISLLFILVVGFLNFALTTVESAWNKYFFIQMIINLMIFFFYVILVSSLFQEDKIKKNATSWIYVIVSIIISIVLISLYNKAIWLSSIHFVLFFVMIFLLKKVSK